MRSAYQEVDIGAKSAIARAIDQNSSHGGRRTLNYNYESLALFQSPGYDGNGRSAVGHVYDHAADEYAAPASNNLKDENKYAASLRTKSGEDEPSAKPRKLENLPSSCTPPSPQQGPDNPIPPTDSSTVDPTLRSAGLTREKCYKGWDSVFSNSQRQNRRYSQSFVDYKRSILGAFAPHLMTWLKTYETFVKVHLWRNSRQGEVPSDYNTQPGLTTGVAQPRTASQEQENIRILSMQPSYIII
jgi:hypothetical protein